MADERSDQSPRSGAEESGDKSLTAWFIRNPVAANLLMFVLLVGGGLMALSARFEVFPTISPGIVQVTVPYPGATPVEVEEGITRRVEEALLGIDGVKRVTSSASENVGSITIEAADFVDLQRLKDDAEAAVDRISQFPPENAEQPVVVVPEPTGGVVTLAVVGDLPPLDLKKAAEQIERDLLSTPGVTLVSLTGDRDYEISIEVSEQALREYGLTFSEVASAVRAGSLDLAAGSIVTEGGEILLRTNERRQTGEAFESIQVRTQNSGAILRVSDVATVNDGFARSRVRSTYNGSPAIFVEVSRARGEDVLSVKRAVDEFLDGYTPPVGVQVLEFRDQTLVLSERVNLLVRNALFGFALVFFFLVLMLDLKLAFWICMGITTAFLGGFLLFGSIGVTLSMISLFGLIVVLGLVVDDAVVIGENIDAERRNASSDTDAAIRGVGGVKAPVLVGVATTIFAFAPLLVTGGTFAEISRAIPLVVISILIISLIEAFFILPSHLSHGGAWSRGLMKQIQDRISRSFAWFSDSLVQPSVRTAARWRYVTLGVAAAFFIFCVSLVANGNVRFIFFPFIEGNEVSASISFPAGAPYERTVDAVERLERAALGIAGEIEEATGREFIVSIVATAGGRASRGGGPGGQSSFTTAENIGQVEVELAPFGQRSISAAEFERRWREAAGQIEGVERLTFNAAIGGFGADIAYELTHSEEAQLLAATDDLKMMVADIEGVSEIEDSFDLGKVQFVFDLNEVGQAAGITSAEIARQLRQAFFGEEVQRIQRGREEVRVYVRYPDYLRESLSVLSQFRVRLPDGSEAPLPTVADIEESRAYSSIERVDGRRVVSVTADVDEAISTSGVANERIVAEILPQLEARYPGLRWTQAGAAREQNEDFASLTRGALIALLVIYAMLATQFRSYLQPIAIMVSIPLGVAGAILGHLVLGYAVSFVSIFGMVALAGVAVNASVVLVDQFNRQRELGEGPDEAAAAASKRRFRPVVITTLTTALGLGPLLFETSPQAQFLIPMGVSLGFGILVSGLMVIFVTPAVTLIVEDIRRALSRKTTPSPEAVGDANA